MPFRKGLSLHPIKTDKHEITWSDLAIDASTVVTKNLAIAVPSGDKNASTEVEVGSHVKWIYFEINFAAKTISNPKVIHWTVAMRPNTLGTPVPSLYYQDARNKILKRGMEMLPKAVSTVYKRIFVVKIPRGQQRLGENDLISFQYIATSAETVNVCGFAIYKEFY